MKYLNTHLFLAIFALLMSACETNSEIENIDKLVVQAYLLPDAHVDSFKLTAVLPFNQSEVALPDDITPIITNASGVPYVLSQLDDARYFENDSLLLQQGETYDLEIEYNNETISASTYIPSAPENVQISDQVIYRTKINDFQDIQGQGIPDPVEITWDNANGDFYFVDVKNIDDDPEVINELFEDFGGAGPAETVTEPSASNSYAINAFADITHFGNYEVTVYRVNPEYVVLYESNNSGSAGLNEITTNVSNAFGIFTGVNFVKQTFEVRKQ